MLEDICSVLGQHGYQIILGTTEYLVTVEEQLMNALPRLFAGWVNLIRGRSFRQDHQIAQTSGSSRGGSHGPYGPPDRHERWILPLRGGGRGCPLSFARKGYRRIAYAGTLSEIDSRSVKRIAGFQQTLKDYGLPYHFIQRINEPFSIGLGAKLLDGLLRQYPNVEAVFFANDDLAAGALFECWRRAIRVPEDLAIMGFNDQEIAGSIVPAITSVATPRREIGRAAAQMLVRQLQGQPPPQLQLDLGFKIVERQSTAAGKVTSECDLI